MLKATSRSVVIVFLLMLGFYGFYSLLSAAEVDRTNPNAVANAFLLAIQTNDYNSIIELMYEEQKVEFQSLFLQNPKEIERTFSQYKESAKGILAVEEFRLMTTFSGKDGLAGSIKKVGNQYFVIILLKEDSLYYYDSCLMLTLKSFNELPEFKQE